MSYQEEQYLPRRRPPPRRVDYDDYEDDYSRGPSQSPPPPPQRHGIPQRQKEAEIRRFKQHMGQYIRGQFTVDEVEEADGFLILELNGPNISVNTEILSAIAEYRAGSKGSVKPNEEDEGMTFLVELKMPKPSLPPQRRRYYSSSSSSYDWWSHCLELGLVINAVLAWRFTYIEQWQRLAEVVFGLE